MCVWGVFFFIWYDARANWGLCVWCWGYLSPSLVGPPAHLFTGSVCLLRGYFPSWEFWLNRSICIWECLSLPRSRCENTWVLSHILHSNCTKNRRVPFRPAAQPGLLRSHAMQLPSRHISTPSPSYPLPHWQVGIPLVLGVKNTFVEMSDRIRMTRWTEAKSTAQGDGLIGTRCRSGRRTDVTGCVTT